ncbi:MAG: anthranilate phosphoribosyltransferase [Pseudomonadota bacterium]|jgi:anthranilate phosphoribosyltransferase|nr:anthranilate phosphoribosyltransferase [Pseudomonadota bacterium]MEC8131705.1 anthranilate phosphoribosyltransferase [Pseudomonadota bacterium]|tara:strand:+ start:1358 stop:2368 length:1011 start_codon:yes stop_codon:yes gene_type:complete
MKEYLQKINNGQDLLLDEMKSAINQIMSGTVSDADIESFLTGLNNKGISENEITGAAVVMKQKSLKIDVNCKENIDTCGTGGTGIHTFNCSTASAFVAAAGGAKITKHGNKAISSKSGSADFLTQAGADIGHDREKLGFIFENVGFIFLFAPLHHEAMKYVMPVRQKISEKTIFNLLGPHTNPCNAKKQIIGVYDEKLLKTFCNVSKNLEMEHVMIVHGSDGLDEITITGRTSIVELKDNNINEFNISPKDFGLSLATLDDIYAKSSEDSLRLVEQAFAGEKSPVQDMIALNSGAALYISGVVDSIGDGVDQSFKLMNNGEAQAKLASYVEISNQL